MLIQILLALCTGALGCNLVAPTKITSLALYHGSSLPFEFCVLVDKCPIVYHMRFDPIPHRSPPEHHASRSDAVEPAPFAPGRFTYLQRAVTHRTASWKTAVQRVTIPCQEQLYRPFNASSDHRPQDRHMINIHSANPSTQSSRNHGQITHKELLAPPPPPLDILVMCLDRNCDIFNHPT